MADDSVSTGKELRDDPCSNGDALVLKPKKNKGKEKSLQYGKAKTHKKMKTNKKESMDFEDSGDRRVQLDVKEALKEDPDFVVEEKGKKRKRKTDHTDGPSSASEAPLPKKKKKVVKEEGQMNLATEKKKKKEAKVKVKKEEGDRPVSVKKKKSKEEIEAARALKLKKKEEEEKQRWRWWEEEKYEDGIKWKFLEHKGPYFPPEYQPLPDDVKFYYNGKAVKLRPQAEEGALYFAQMLDHEYTTKEVFRNNFFRDWRKDMSLEEKQLITDLNKCDFGELLVMHKQRVEARKNMSKEEKQVIKEANQKIVEEYGFCVLDHHRERIGNFKIEPPALFRGRGDHPKQGMLKKRIQPEDVIINCSKDSSIPEPPAGHRWKEVRHDNTVTWLASWTENVQGSCKYVMLNANSKLKGEKDWEKYEVARRLKLCVDAIRAQYLEDLKSKQMGTRQRAVAFYFIDKLALRAGNEKEEGETADTVGCCSLRVEHITLHDTLDGEKCVVEFDFLGKDCIRYYNKVPVIKRVFKNLKLFMEKKQGGDDLFDRLNTQLLNKHLSSLMAGLTAKVFRTYNASITLQQQLQKLTNKTDNVAEKLLSYNRANRAVAILCNHQRAPPKTFDQSMANLQAKIDSRKEQLALAKKELKQAKKDCKGSSDNKLLILVDKKKKAVQRCEEQLLRMEVQATDKEENKQIALSTSKLNYLDPRISVAWCKNIEVPLDKIYNKTLRDKFAWAIDMTENDFVF
ncbi:DNA topoisomerase I, mitochondrial isoform X1 [Triplophysa dalaica]|uniref:DNA topoisomerase I, mitochondrial isoform X1 n=2 Tax=Triplophysa dalaica TaxID=1582913 RepID=UPI0024DFFAFA|nr:DNA topoisomerase I, mitochondrial isoform X1 [Triplophysa dalaica]XP_056622351.1 DNA topoisomerase I, mitochondrial isoform X1 [Triplophysa dalaica]